MRRSSAMRALPALCLALAATSCGSPPPPDPNEIVLAKPAHGVQLQTPLFQVEQGKERQHCYWFKLPSDVDLDVVRIEVKYLEGSHHMNLFQTDEDFPEHDNDCFSGVFSPMGTNGYHLLVGSQTTSMDWRLPEGVAFKLKAHRQLMLQTHYVNAGTQPTPTGAGRVVVNLHDEPDKARVKHAMGTMFANNVNIAIPPRQSREFSTSCRVTQDVHVVALTGHFHSRGKAFSVNVSPDGAALADEIYRSRDWDEPPFTVLAEPLALKAHGALSYTCAFQNSTDAAIKFGPKVETDEHCNLFAYYFPADATGTRYCF